jgi:hypothetical protein
MADGGYHKGYYWQVSCCLLADELLFITAVPIIVQ